MSNLYRKLDKLGREKLSKSFQFRQFLYSEVALAAGLINLPDDPDLALAAGRELCTNILEPLADRFGSIIVRSGYRSSEVNAYGNRHKMSCASNERNYGRHIWDRLDPWDNMGATACIIVPAFNAGETEHKTWQDFAWWLDEQFDHNGICFFMKENAFNISWSEDGDPFIKSTHDEARILRQSTRDLKTATAPRSTQRQGNLL